MGTRGEKKAKYFAQQLKTQNANQKHTRELSTMTHLVIWMKGKQKKPVSGKIFLFRNNQLSLWQYRLWSFQRRDTKLEKFLSRN